MRLWGARSYRLATGNVRAQSPIAGMVRRLRVHEAVAPAQATFPTAPPLRREGAGELFILGRSDAGAAAGTARVPVGRRGPLGRVARPRIAYFAATGSMRAVFQCWAAAWLPMNWASASAAPESDALVVSATS